MIGIGTVYGEPGQMKSPVGNVITQIMQTVERLRGDFEIGSSPAVNPVFHVPGSLVGVDFKGCRTSSFFRKQKIFMVQIAVPKEKLDADDLLDFLLESLHEANALAFHRFKKHGMEFPLSEAEKLIDRVKEELSNTDH